MFFNNVTSKDLVCSNATVERSLGGGIATIGPAQGRTAVDFGAMIGFSGIVTFRQTDLLRQTASAVPDDRLLIETDAPYLSPEPVRRMRPNEPGNVVHTIRFAAHLRGETEDHLGEISTANALRFFRLE